MQASFLGHVTAFLWSSSDADGVSALDTCDLADYRSDRAGSGRVHHCLASGRFVDLEQAH
jgi:hypothetical protein